MAAIQRHMHRLAGDRWKTWKNPSTIVHGGRELRVSGLRLLQLQNHTRIQRFMSRQPASSPCPVNYRASWDESVVRLPSRASAHRHRFNG
jgi:hypothetical protein